MTGWLSQTEVITVSLLWWSTDHNVSLIHFLSNRQPWMDLYSRNLGPFVLYSATHPPDSVNIQRLAPIHDCGKYSIFPLSLHCHSLSVSFVKLYLNFCICILYLYLVSVFCICIVNFVFGLDLHWFLPTINPWEEEAITQAANHSTKPSKAPSIASFGKVHRL